jgi:hypothetical protein
VAPEEPVQTAADDVVEGEVQELDEVTAMKARIDACTTRAQLLLLIPDIKKIDSSRIAEVRAHYGDHQRSLP